MKLSSHFLLLAVFALILGKAAFAGPQNGFSGRLGPWWEDRRGPQPAEAEWRGEVGRWRCPSPETQWELIYFTRDTIIELRYFTYFETVRVWYSYPVRGGQWIERRVPGKIETLPYTIPGGRVFCIPTDPINLI